MTMLKIIKQIDVCLSRLQLARDILAKPPADRSSKTTKTKNSPKKTRIGRSKNARPPLSSSFEAQRGHRKGDSKCVVGPAIIAGVPQIQVEEIKRLADTVPIMDPETPAVIDVNCQQPLPSLNRDIRRLSYTVPSESNRPLHARSLKASVPAHATWSRDGSVNSKIVVIPPEQARKEREQNGQPKIQPRAVRKSGLTGRLAFESLFRDTDGR
jgi:hypothetical protein